MGSDGLRQIALRLSQNRNCDMIVQRPSFPFRSRIIVANLDKRTYTVRYIGCGALVPDIDGTTFRYSDAASPGWWAVYGETSALEYRPLNCPDAHRLAVDT